MKRKMLAWFTAAALAVCCFAVPVSAENVNVVLNGMPISFDVPAQTINDRTMVPMRAIFEAIGAEVDWDDESQTAYGYKTGINIHIQVDSNVMLKNFNDILLDTPAQLIDGRVLVPVRAVSESFGINVDWDEASKTVKLTDNNVLQSIVLANNMTYEGEVSNGLPAGFGTMHEISAGCDSTLTGYWDGKTMKYGYEFTSFPNGDSFNGYIVNDVRSGYGEYYWAGGDCYKGNYENGSGNGYGEYYWAGGGCYKGNHKNGLEDGYGEIYYPDGDYYKGNWKNGKRSGIGEYFYANGDSYKGNYANGERSGYGEEYFADGGCYKGNYENGERSGIGEFFYANGDYFKGAYKNGVRNGYGEEYFANGDCYKGNYENDKYNGYGEYYWSDGDSYKGMFVNGERANRF